MKREIVKWSQKLMVVGFLTMLCAGSGLAGLKVKYAIIGSVETLDKAAKSVAVKTADGVIETSKLTGKTTAYGLKAGAKAIDFAGRQGSHVVVHYWIRGAEKTANAFDYVRARSAEGG